VPRRLLVVLTVSTAIGAMPRLTAVDSGVLRSCADMGASEHSRVAGGDAVVKTLPVSNRRELAIAGAIRMRVPADFFVRRMRDIARFKHSDLVLQVRRFSDPPALDDLAPLQIDRADLEALERCRVGDCEVKLPAGAIERLRTEVDSDARDASAQRERVAKRMLLERALGYLDDGDRTLGMYLDKHRRPISPAEDLRDIVASLTCGGIHPDEIAYLADFPRRQTEGAESFLYWSKETFGLKPMVSLTHVIIFAPRAGRRVVASKGIYSSHYVDASVALTWLFDVDVEGEAAVDVLYVNRARIDALGGRFGGLARTLSAGRQRDRMGSELRALRTRLEADWRATRDGAVAGQR
jgi:hypothetical protein